jgi:hypothetical protein
VKKYIPLLTISLLISLFIYVFYRTEKTLVNQLFMAMISRESYVILKAGITSILPLNDYIVYSLPEGLWVFCITVTSSFFYLEVRRRKWRMVFVPVLVAITMEIFQLLHLANGQFDVMDILFSTGFWLLALFYTRNDTSKEPLFRSVDTKAVCCMLSYCIVYLAHVIH